MTIAIDFDGTCVTHKYPAVGEEIGAVPVLRRLIKAGHKLALFTMRSHMPGISPVTNKTEQGGLQDAIDWFSKHGIPLHGIQSNPGQEKWTSSPKCYAHLYIDDAALGCPLVKPVGERAYVDWQEVSFELESIGLIEKEEQVA